MLIMNYFHGNNDDFSFRYFVWINWLRIMEVRCKHCCKTLLKGDSILLNAHCEVKQHPTDVGCQTEESDCCSYMTAENVPSWIMNLIDQVYSLMKIYLKVFKGKCMYVFVSNMIIECNYFFPGILDQGKAALSTL